MQVELLPLSAIHPNPNNPRVIKDDKFKKLVKSIQEFPEMLKLRPIVIDEAGMVLGGNMRLKALQSIGVKETYVVRAESLTQAQKSEFVIKDNLAYGEMDWEAIANEWDTDQLTDWGLDIPGFATGSVEEDNYEVPDEIETDIVRGDIIEIGQHRLMCGDSTSAEDVTKLMQGEKADMVFTDPPYGVGYEGGRNPISNVPREKLKGDTNGNLYSDALIQSTLFAKSSAPIYLWFAGTIGKPVYEAVEANGYKVRAMIVWNKLNSHYGNFMAQYMQKHEPCLYCVKDKPNWYGATNEVTVWDIAQPSKNEHHPTQKPVELAGRALSNSSKSEDLILDLFIGSGTTMVAAHQLNRKCYGMEIEPKYCQIIIERMSKLDPELEVKINGIAIKTEYAI